MKRLKEALLLLVAGTTNPIGAQWLDHPLVGVWADDRECHVGGDFLLIQRFSGTGDGEQVVFVRAGTHVDLFEGCLLAVEHMSRQPRSSSYMRP